MAVAALARPVTIERQMPPARPTPALQVRPIPVAAYPAGVPRWVTYEGKRRRVLAVHEQPPLEDTPLPVATHARRLHVELSGGRQLTLVQDHGAWFER